MHAMQYVITLPADYDMRIIRNRVAGRGHLTDAFAGLGIKAFLMRERGVDGSPVNEYTPFYLWRDTGGIGHFLVGGGGFQGIIDSFGRPVVQHWAGLACEPGPARGTVPRAASRTIAPIPDGVDQVALIEQALDEVKHLAGVDGVHTTALAFDPLRWHTVRFTLWEHAVPADEPATERYEVLHLSAPELDAIPSGRHW